MRYDLSKRAGMAFVSMACAAALTGCELSGAQPAGYASQVRLAEQFLDNGQYGRGYGVLDRIDSGHKDSAQVQLALGDSYLRSLALLKAERAYTAAAKLGAADTAEVGLGRIALARNDGAYAKELFGRVLERDFKNPDALNGMGVAYDLLGDHAKAQNHYNLALEVAPTHSRSRNNLGLSLILSGDYRTAERVLSDLAGSELNNKSARLNLAMALYAQGRERDALALAEDVEEQSALRLFQAVTRYSQELS